MATRKTTSTKQTDTDQREDTRTDPHVDVVAMPSRKADGSPDQTDGFLVVGEDGEARSLKDVEAEAQGS